MRPLTILTIAAAALATGPVLAQVAGPAPADPARTVEFELSEGRTVVAAPTVQVQVGRPAAISAGGYSLRLRMDRAATDAQGDYVIRSQLYRSQGWLLVASPAVTVTEGEQTRLNFTGSDGSAMSLAVLLR
jgi:hypothetical protein